LPGKNIKIILLKFKVSMIGIDSSDSYLLEEYEEGCINLLDTITLVPTTYRTSANSRNF